MKTFVILLILFTGVSNYAQTNDEKEFVKVRNDELPTPDVVDNFFKEAGLYETCEKENLYQLEKDLIFRWVAHVPFEEYKNKTLKDRSGDFTYSDIFDEDKLLDFYQAVRDFYLSQEK